MSLARWERKALRKIEADIWRSDPGLARLLGGFEEPAAGHAVPAARHGRRAGQQSFVRWAVRVAAHGVAAAVGAVCAPGVRERLGVRSQPHPMARTPWQRLI